METPSQLDQFLDLQESEGELVSTESDFTLAVDAALRKIAEFQLPFEYAWAVKLVQCAVSEGSGQPIRVDFTRREARFYFVASTFTVDQVEQAFYEPHPNPNPSLNHLISALWAAGVRGGLPFQLLLPGESECLLWDGKNLHRATPDEKRDCTYVAVATARPVCKMEWIKQMASSAATNADLLKTMLRWCYASPVPLTVDGRRVDSLFNCPSHQLRNTQFPLLSGYLEQLTPELAIPPGTFRALISPEGETGPRGVLSVFAGNEFPGFNRNANSLPERMKVTQRSGGAYILTTFWSWVGQGKQKKLEPVPSYSVVCWVRDGVVVELEHVKSKPCSCSAALFLSAEGLATDLTGFQLAQSAERDRRRQEAVKAMVRQLNTFGCLERSMKEVVSGIASGGRLLGGLFLCVGLVALPASPIHGLAFAGGAATTIYSAGSKGEKTAEQLRTAVEMLRTSLIAATVNS